MPRGFHWLKVLGQAGRAKRLQLEVKRRKPEGDWEQTMQARYEKTRVSWDPEEQAILLTKRVAVVGLGAWAGMLQGNLRV